MIADLAPVVPDLLAAMHAVTRRAEAHDRIPIVTPLEEFQEWLDDPHLDLAADARVARAGSEVVGWARVWHRPSAVREERAYLFGVVDPEYRRRGIGSALFQWQLERAIHKLSDNPARIPCFVRAMAYEFQSSSLALYQRHGLTPVRYADELLRDLGELPEPITIPGIRIVPWDPSRFEGARLAMNEAFSDHWGSTPVDAAAWEHLIRSSQTRLDFSWMALDGDRVVGVCRNGHFPEDERVTGRRDGWIMQVGTVRSHRRRGIASALVAMSLAVFKAAGLTHSGLGVDSANPTGAYQIYERLGYRRMHRSVVHQLALEPPSTEA